MSASIITLRKKARLAGWLYLISAATGIFGFMYVSPKIMVHDDMAATAKNMIAHESLFRLRILTDTASNILFIVVLFLLYQLLKHVAGLPAKLMVVFMFVAMPAFFIDEALHLAVLQIFKGNLLTSLNSGQAQGIAQTLLEINNYALQLSVFNWGLWLMPLGWLVYKSGFIPKIFGILLLINGVGYMARNITFIILPGYAETIAQFLYPTFFLGEIPFIFWLIIKGVKEKNIGLENAV